MNSAPKPSPIIATRTLMTQLSWLGSGRGRRGERFAQEVGAAAGELVARGVERAPQAHGLGDLAHGGGEGLDHQRAGEADLGDRGEDVVPRHVAGSGRAAVVLARV